MKDEKKKIKKAGQVKKCPICGKPIKGFPAISRKDNKTEICSDCGTEEAMEAFNKYYGLIK